MPKVVGGIATFMDGRRWLKLEGLGGFEWMGEGFASNSEWVWVEELGE